MSDAILLSNGTRFEHAEDRIREYCEIEVYEGYDDKHSVDNRITMADVAAANRLYATIDRYDKTESSRILGGVELEEALAKLPDVDLLGLDRPTWAGLSPGVETLFSRFLSLKGVGLAKATKILHLKRPHLFPVLDSFEMRFLSGIDPEGSTKAKLVDLGVSVVGVARQDLEQNREQFRKLGDAIADLPIPLTFVRMYDILCWTEEKWVRRGNTHAEYGTAKKSI